MQQWHHFQGPQRVQYFLLTQGEKTGLNIVSTKTNVFLGIPLENDFPVKQAINTCLIISKQYIYACRCLNKIPNFHELLERIKFYKIIEYKIASKNDKVTKHNRKWESLKFWAQIVVNEYNYVIHQEKVTNDMLYP